jgi:glutamyl/glutaminyl-tRNA synthetase
VTAAQSRIVNTAGGQHQHPAPLVPLTRADGSALWHLATVIDDMDLDINLIVRGTDKGGRA